MIAGGCVWVRSQPFLPVQIFLPGWFPGRGIGGDAASFCQLTDFNPTVSGGRGFTYADLKAEIRAGRPVLLFMQPSGEFSRTVAGVVGVNPDIHGMLAYGYWVDDDGTEYVRYRTSWASGDQMLSPWTAAPWLPGTLGFPLRG